MARLAEVYGRLGRYAEQAAALREAYVSLFLTEQLEPSAAVEPFETAVRSRRTLEKLIPVIGENDDDDDGGGDPKRIPAAALPTVRTDGLGAAELLAQLDQVRKCRNDMLHLGLRPDARHPSTIRETLKAGTDFLVQLLSRRE
jgi:hypothetical protein